MRFELEHLTELTDQIQWEGSARLLLAPISNWSPDIVIPQQWRELLVLENAHRVVASLLWSGVRDRLPKVVTSIEERLQAVGLLTTDRKGPSLVYIFSKQTEIFARRGYAGISNLPPVAAQFPVDVSGVYRVHNGWVDFFSEDTGPLPVQAWKTLGDDPDENDRFIEIFATGGNSMGFDLSESPVQPYLIWSDGDVEPVDDFWKRLDDWIAGDLEDTDYNSEPDAPFS